jgi:hypothetical protein
MLFKQTKKEIRMGNYLYLLSIFLFAIWATGYFVYDATGIIHILLICAIAVVMLRLIKGNKP